MVGSDRQEVQRGRLPIVIFTCPCPSAQHRTHPVHVYYFCPLHIVLREPRSLQFDRAIYTRYHRAGHVPRPQSDTDERDRYRLVTHPHNTGDLFSANFSSRLSRTRFRIPIRTVTYET